MRRAIVAAGLAMTASLVGAAPAHAEPAPSTLVAKCTHLTVKAATPQALMLAELNCARKVAKLPALRAYKPIGGVAASWSAHMAATGQLVHNANRASEINAVDPRWEKIGEIIAATQVGSGAVDRIVTSWFTSSVHRHVILDPKLHVVGLGLKTGDGWMWATGDFVDQ